MSAYKARKLQVAVLSVTIFSILLLCPCLAEAQERWKKYRLITAAFEIKYPPEWKASEESVDKYEGPAPGAYPRNWNNAIKEKHRVAIFNSPMIAGRDYFVGATITICSTPINIPLSQYSTCRQQDAGRSELYKDQVVSRTKFNIKGVKIERTETKSTYTPDFYYYARIFYGGRRFFMTGSFTKHLGVDRYAPVFDKMLSSFRPLSQGKGRTR